MHIEMNERQIRYHITTLREANTLLTVVYPFILSDVVRITECCYWSSQLSFLLFPPLQRSAWGNAAGFWVGVSESSGLERLI